MKHLKIISLICFLTIYSCIQSLEIAHLNEGWYPNKKEALQSFLSHLSKKAETVYGADIDPKSIKAIIVPHAGYNYSGTVASSVYRLLDKNTINKVIILAPDHSVSFNGIALPVFEQYQTPLGMGTVDAPSIKTLAKNPLFHKNENVFKTEHSLEIQLPFIQYYLKNDITLVPLIVGKLTCAQAQSIAHALRSIITTSTLVIVSTDFIHYGKRFNFVPFKDHIAYNIRRLDSQAVELIQKGICKSFAQFMERSKATICGHYPLEILLSLLEINAFGAVEPRFIAYHTSGEQEKDAENSVSYIEISINAHRVE